MPSSRERAEWDLLERLRDSRNELESLLAESGRWSIWIDASWRLTFELREGDVFVLDHEDYH